MAAMAALLFIVPITGYKARYAKTPYARARLGTNRGMKMIKNYGDFCAELLKAGFCMASGGSDEGVFGLLPYAWNEQPPDSPIRWFTGDAETDPWEWRMRVLEERDDIAYAKVFFRKAGYIAKEWYPYFWAARRGGKTLEDEYADGMISRSAKRIYGVICENGSVPLHEIKRLAGFSREDKATFDRALTELQMGLYVTMCGRQQKRSRKGEEYGWSSTVFSTAERFWGEDAIEKAAKISEREAVEKITDRILRLNPKAQAKRIIKFIKG